MIQVDDRALVHRAKAGEFNAFDELVTRHEGRVYSIAMSILRHRQDAEDVVQTAFLNAFSHLNAFREDAAFGTWITRIAVNSALKALRKRKGTSAVSMNQPAQSDDDGEIPHPQFIAHWREEPLRILEQKHIRQLLDTAIQALPEKQRVVFLLRDVQGLSVREAADVLKLSQANIKVRLLRARLALREKLTSVFGDERGRLAHGPGHAGPDSTPVAAMRRSYENQ